MQLLAVLLLTACTGLGAYSEGSGVCIGKDCPDGGGDDTDVVDVTPDGEDCTDNVDNNNDQLADCEDPGCISACDQDDDGFITDARGGDDCDDTTSAIRPDAVELCDQIDNDCDRLIDDEDADVVGATTWYADQDNDGYGDPDVYAVRCGPTEVEQVVDRAGDCDPASNLVNPSEAERVCDDIDNDCNPATPDSRDGDGDGYSSCDDCDDANTAINPDADDVCGDGADTNCDGFECGTFSDNFESGSLSSAWTTVGGDWWQTTTTRPHNGSWCARSGNISDNQLSTLEVTLSYARQGEITFWHRESSESGYDYLIFLVDGVEQSRWSGDTVWQQETWRVPAGMHTFKWRYDKDASQSRNDDAVYIDDIRADGTVVP